MDMFGGRASPRGALLDHLVGTGEQGGRYREPEPGFARCQRNLEAD